jgi:hypothetical protein
MRPGQTRDARKGVAKTRSGLRLQWTGYRARTRRTRFGPTAWAAGETKGGRPHHAPPACREKGSPGDRLARLGAPHGSQRVSRPGTDPLLCVRYFFP